MRLINAMVVTGAAALAGLAAAQPARAPTSPTAAMTFRPTAQVRLADTQATRLELRQAKLRPAAVALRRSLAQTGAARIDLAAVDRTALPVLVAARPSLASNLRVFARATSFSASATEPGMTLVIDGSKTATAAPPQFRMPATMILRPQATAASPTLATSAVRREAVVAPPAHAPTIAAVRGPAVREAMVRPLARPGAATPPPAQPAPPPGAAPVLQDVVIERAEYGLDVSFVRFGAVYNVAIACDAPDTDPRCSEDGAKALVSQLETIGGGETPQ